MTQRVPDVLMVGTGEYTTGYTASGQSQSDKKIGVVALVFFDLRRRGVTGPRLGLCGTTGSKFPAIREHLARNIGAVYRGVDTHLETWPEDGVARDEHSYKAAIDAFRPGDIVTVFTPDDTHFDIAMYAIQKKMHVLLTKPPVKTLEHHRLLLAAAAENDVVVSIDYHKREDPCFADARHRLRGYGDMDYWYSYMSQPKLQLDTFRAWAGRSSDISYYLNSHFVDLHVWAVGGRCRPLSVTALASTGAAEAAGCPAGTADTITLLTKWQNIGSGHIATAVYTASWAAPNKSEVHSQHRCHYLGRTGELRVDQAHRGYDSNTDSGGYVSVNPHYMSYAPDAMGFYAGQRGYGHVSLERFASAVAAVLSGSAKARDFDDALPSLYSTVVTTAILEAGSRSLAAGGKTVEFRFDSDGQIQFA